MQHDALVVRILRQKLLAHTLGLVVVLRVGVAREQDLVPRVARLGRHRDRLLHRLGRLGELLHAVKGVALERIGLALFRAGLAQPLLDGLERGVVVLFLEVELRVLVDRVEVRAIVERVELDRLLVVGDGLVGLVLFPGDVGEADQRRGLFVVAGLGRVQHLVERGRGLVGLVRIDGVVAGLELLLPRLGDRGLGLLAGRVGEVVLFLGRPRLGRARRNRIGARERHAGGAEHDDAKQQLGGVHEILPCAANPSPRPSLSGMGEVNAPAVRHSSKPRRARAC